VSTKQTQETTRTVDAARGNEKVISDLFTKIAQEAGGQLGDLGPDLAAGPTAQDRELVEQSIGASSDIAQRELERSIEQIMAQLSEQLAGRGIQGSSIESMLAGQAGSQGIQSMENLLSREQAQGGQALLNLPFQRAQTEIGRNQALLQRLTSLGTPIQQAGLNERLNTIDTTTVNTQSGGANAMNIGKLAARAAAAYFTGGASEAALAASSRPGRGGIPLANAANAPAPIGPRLPDGSF
jgi:hypothetical protein